MKKILLFLLFFPILNVKANETILILDKEEYKVGEEIKIHLKYNGEYIKGSAKIFSSNDNIEILTKEIEVEGQGINYHAIGKVKKDGKVVISGAINELMASIPLEIKKEVKKEERKEEVVKQYVKVEKPKEVIKVIEKNNPILKGFVLLLAFTNLITVVLLWREKYY